LCSFRIKSNTEVNCSIRFEILNIRTALLYLLTYLLFRRHTKKAVTQQWHTASLLLLQILLLLLLIYYYNVHLIKLWESGYDLCSCTAMFYIILETSTDWHQVTISQGHSVLMLTHNTGPTTETGCSRTFAYENSI